MNLAASTPATDGMRTILVMLQIRDTESIVTAAEQASLMINSVSMKQYFGTQP